MLLLAGLVTQLASGHDLAIQVKMFDLLAPASTGEKLMAFEMLAFTLTPALGVLTVFASLAARARRHLRRRWRGGDRGPRHLGRGGAGGLSGCRRAPSTVAARCPCRPSC